MTDYSKLFQNACLVQFSTSSWQCTKALNPAAIKDKVGIDNEWFKGRKYLINPDLLGLSVILIIDGLFFTVFEGKYQFTSDLD